MSPDSDIPESTLSYPVWVLEFLVDEYPELYNDLIKRRTPLWLKPQVYEDFMYDSIIQKLILWADPNFIEFSVGFIQAVDSIMRSDIPVIHLNDLFQNPVSTL